MNTEFCDRYREREYPNRHMLALKNARIDFAKWKLISSGAVPPKKAIELAAKGFLIIGPAPDKRRQRNTSSRLERPALVM
jgi:hypothetical protein